MAMSGECGRQATRPWLRADVFRAIPSPRREGYGFVRGDDEDKRGRVVQDLEQLRARILAAADPIELVWTPGATHLTPVYEVEEVAEAVEARARRDARARLRRAVPRALLLLAAVALGIAFWPEVRAARSFLLLGILLLFGPLWYGGIQALIDARRDLGSLRAAPAAWRTRRGRRLRFGTWSVGHSSWTGTGLVCVCVVLFVTSMVAGRREVIEALALVPARVHDGEVWRLFTCSLLHGSVLHIYFNSMVALILAAQARSLVSEARVLLVFVLSAIAGSVASVTLTGLTSVGASGGILGWGGMLAGMAWADPDIRETGLLGDMLRWVLLLAVIGVVGSAFIDNAAHAGGFLAGLALGFAFGRSARRGGLPVGGAGLDVAWWALALPVLGCAAAMLYVMVFRVVG